MIVLTVLDFEDGLVYQYDIETNNDKMRDFDFEKIMMSQGHKLSNCEWMSHSDNTLNKIKIEY